MTAIAYALRAVSVDKGGRRILDDVSLEIGYGRLLALVGPNGAGKSTLLSVLTGDTPTTSGAVTLEGAELAGWPARELARIRSVLLQENQVAFAFRAGDVVEMGRAPWAGVADAADDERAIADAIERADVADLLERPYPELSGGEKARVSLARVLAQDTSIVLLDEPTAALDLRHQEDVLRTARELARAGRAVVVVLHDLSLAAAYADEVAMIDRGRLVACGAPADVLTATRIAEVYGTTVHVIADPSTGAPVVLPVRE